MDLISIIIPYYKKKHFVKQSVNSVLNQTYKNIEVILIYDDISYEDLNYIKSIRNLDSRIKLIINKKNYGAGVSRNIGIKSSRGKYIAFIDADDYWYPSKLEKQIEYLKEKKVLFVIHLTK